MSELKANDLIFYIKGNKFAYEHCIGKIGKIICIHEGYYEVEFIDGQEHPCCGENLIKIGTTNE